MNKNLSDIKNTLVNISKDSSLLGTLYSFDRVLDGVNLYAYKNWDNGELVDGPRVSRYWYTVTLMYPYTGMPDPDGGLRLTKLGAKVSFKKGVFKHPEKISNETDWRNQYTKKAKILDSDVWLVKISLPMRYIDNFLDNEDLPTDDGDSNDIEA